MSMAYLPTVGAVPQVAGPPATAAALLAAIQATQQALQMNNGVPSPPVAMPGPVDTTGGPPRSLTQGMPDPDSIEHQKEAYSKSLDEQTKQGKELLTAQQKHQTELIQQAAEAQKKHLISQIEEQARQQEVLLGQKYAAQLVALEQASLMRKAELEKQAKDLATEYQMRKTREEELEKEYQQRQAQFEEMCKQQPSKWMYNPGVMEPFDIRASPDVDGDRTPMVLEVGEVFDVVEERQGESGVLFLKLADGRGWAFDKKPAGNSMCSQIVTGAPSRHHVLTGGGSHYIAPAGQPTMWLHQPEFVAPLGIREAPDINGPRTGGVLMPGEVFAVKEELEGTNGILYLKLADGSGWAFDRKPGVGSLCQRHTTALAPPVPAPGSTSSGLRPAVTAPLPTVPALMPAAAPGSSYAAPPVTMVPGGSMPSVVPGSSYVPPGGSYVPPPPMSQGQVVSSLPLTMSAGLPPPTTTTVQTGSVAIPSMPLLAGSMPTTTLGVAPSTARGVAPSPPQDFPVQTSVPAPLAPPPPHQYGLPPMLLQTAHPGQTSVPLPTGPVGTSAPRLLSTRVTVYR